MLAQLIGGFITILVGVILTPAIADQVVSATNGSISNVTGAASTITGLITLFWCIAVVSVGIALVSEGMKQAGMLGL